MRFLPSYENITTSLNSSITILLFDFDCYFFTLYSLLVCGYVIIVTVVLILPISKRNSNYVSRNKYSTFVNYQ